MNDVTRSDAPNQQVLLAREAAAHCDYSEDNAGKTSFEIPIPRSDRAEEPREPNRTPKKSVEQEVRGLRPVQSRGELRQGAAGVVRRQGHEAAAPEQRRRQAEQRRARPNH